MDQERISLLALHLIEGVGNFLMKQLVSYCGSACEVFRQSRGRLLKIPGVGLVTAEAIRRGRTFHQAEIEFKRAAREDTELLFFMDKAYPGRLKSIDDAPAVLYAKGNTNLNHRRTVGIVGTRQATDYGKEQVEQLVEGLVPHQAMIISGLAYGIDIHAHKQAMRYGLPTVGVLGSGMDVIYPAAHREIAGKMLNHGALLTENAFGTQPDAHLFPARNRIIAGMCDTLVVVEAAQQGGALITAEIANSYNKDVFAIPGNIGSTFSEGCNKLIKINKANLLTSVKDIEYIMNWAAQGEKSHLQLSLDWDGFREHERIVLKLLQEKNLPIMIDELCQKAGMDQSAMASLLLELEFKNAVVSMPGKRYKLSR